MVRPVLIRVALSGMLSLSALCVAGLPGMAPPAAAQSYELQDLRFQVQQLQAQLETLQRQAYGGAQMGGAPALGGAGGNVEVRLSKLETMYRELNGRIEEMGFQIKRLGDRIDVAQKDVDLRLSALEGGGGASAAGVDVASADAARPANDAAGMAASDGGGAPPPDGGMGTLGTLRGNPDEVAPPPPLAGRSTQTAALSPRDQYNAAMALLRQGDYAAAESGFSDFLSLYPDDGLAPNAQYWLGESHYVRGDYEAAAATFLGSVKQYPSGAKAPDSMLKLGMSLIEMGQAREACAALGEIGSRYPDASTAIKQRVQRERQRAGCS
ncbi:tol-pal system protein YbgF [Zavarzinia sp. CC-PAN008]|uniref:tol-pal system protein YbgF n=1 Tax=Zavarzinia sp. CC-PAN008 TaxID=3243332 RepID=UPI003F743A0B